MSPLLLVLGLPASAATLVVDPADSAAFATIADAIAAASSGDTVSLAAGTYAECVDPGGLDLILEGPASGSPAVVDGSGICEVTVLVDGGEQLTLRTLQVANTGARAVRFADSTLMMEGVTISSSGGTSLAGGAIYGADGTLTTADCTFSANQGTEGGAIYLYHGVQYTDAGSLFSANAATAGNGGAIHAGWNDTVSLTGTTFEDNTATGNGGALHGAWYTVISMDSTSWTDNTAEGSGGAISTYVVSDTLSVTDSSFLRNTARTGWGGAIEVEWYTQLSVSGSTFEDNTTAETGGAISQWYESSAIIDDSTFTGNVAAASGGAVYWNPSQGYVDTLRVTDSAFSRNTAGSWGGALWAGRADQIDVERSVFDNNTAAGNGGGIAVYVANRLGIVDARFCGNVASLGGGAQIEWATEDAVVRTQFIDNVAGRGGGLFRYVSKGGVAEHNAFVGNHAETWGGAYVDEWGTTTLENSAFFYNQGLGAIYTDSATSAGSTPVRFNAWGDNGEVHGAGYFWVEPGVDGNTTGDPRFAAYTAGADCAAQDLHPLAGSVLIDSADPATFDRDGSPADIGPYGGADAPLADHDGDGAPSDTDCLDGDPSVHPGAEEVCDGVDNNCDGTIDGATATDATPWFVDLDGDGFGDPTTEAMGCGAEGWVSTAGDCDDSDSGVHPEAEDAWYDGIDTNCDGAPDHDADGDGYDKPVGDNGGRDCDDSNASVYPTAEDPPGDGIDQDCDGADDPAPEVGEELSAGGSSDSADKGGCSTVGALPLAIGWLVLPALIGRTRRQLRAQ